jgi:hypothetical protein
VDRRPSFAAALAVILATGRLAAAGESSEPAPPTATPDSRPAGESRAITAVRIAKPPTLDGRVDDPVWATAPGTSGFTQQSPVGGAEPSEPTTMRVLYDDVAIYLGIDCTQTRTPVIGRLTRRDQDSESDWVWFSVDSRRDGRTAAFFAVNVAGVVVDGTSRDTPTGSITSMEWDENWEAWTARTATGWSAELRIPLRILRFASDVPVQSWGFSVERFIAARQETDIWPFIPREAATPIAHFGRLDDLKNLRAGAPLELRPFVLGRERRLGADPTVAASGFDTGASAGLDLKLHLTPSITFDGAVNPDFAQVEADELTFNFLSHYEIFYPEKRPLFLEGAEQFITPLPLFYSRRIGASPATPTLQGSASGGTTERFVRVPESATIYGAGKLVGRLGDSWTLGTFSALTSRNDYQVLPAGGGPAQRRAAEPLTAFNVLRLRRDLGGSGQLGIIGTATSRFEQTGQLKTCPSGVTTTDPAARCFRDAYVGGLDALWRFGGGDYLASGQVVEGLVEHGQTEVQLDGTAIGSGDHGAAGWFRLAKEGGSPVLADLTYMGIGRRLTFNDLGFMQRQNLHELKGGFELRSLDPGALTLERHARLDVTSDRSLDGLDLGTLVELGVTTRLRNFWILHLSAELERGRFDDREVGTGAALERALFVGGKLEVSTDPLRLLSVDLKGETRFLDSGLFVNAQTTVTVRPLSQLEIDLTPLLAYTRGEPRYVLNAAMQPALDGDPDHLFGRLRASSASATLRASYTFTPRLSLQTYAQLFLTADHYYGFSTSPAENGRRIHIADLVPTTTVPLDADVEQAALNMNVVLRWEYRLGSTLFVVYSRSQAPAVGLLPGEAAALRAADVGRVPAVDILLVKLSFWWAT